jgi:hypothetical protein
MMNPALAVGRAMAAANKAGGDAGEESKKTRERGGEGDQGEGDEAAKFARSDGGGGVRAGKLDLAALRDKLKKKRPSFM